MRLVLILTVLSMAVVAAVNFFNTPDLPTLPYYRQYAEHYGECHVINSAGFEECLEEYSGPDPLVIIIIGDGIVRPRHRN